MKYKHIITIAYPATTEGSLVMHFNIIDESPAQYSWIDLVNMRLCNEIPGQEIWGTYYKRLDWIYPVFYCKKPLGEKRMQLKCQSANVNEPYFELDSWNVDGVDRSVVFFTSTTIKLND